MRGWRYSLASLFVLITGICVAMGFPTLFWGTLGILGGTIVVLFLFIALFYLPVSRFGRKASSQEKSQQDLHL